MADGDVVLHGDAHGVPHGEETAGVGEEDEELARPLFVVQPDAQNLPGKTQAHCGNALRYLTQRYRQDAECRMPSTCQVNQVH